MTTAKAWPASDEGFFLCPSCSQKRALLFAEYLDEQLLLLPHRQFVFTLPVHDTSRLAQCLRPRTIGLFLGMGKDEMAEIAGIISLVLKNTSPAAGKKPGEMSKAKYEIKAHVKKEAVDRVKNPRSFSGLPGTRP